MQPPSQLSSFYLSVLHGIVCTYSGLGRYEGWRLGGIHRIKGEVLVLDPAPELVPGQCYVGIARGDVGLVLLRGARSYEHDADVIAVQLSEIGAVRLQGGRDLGKVADLLGMVLPDDLDDRGTRRGYPGALALMGGGVLVYRRRDEGGPDGRLAHSVEAEPLQGGKQPVLPSCELACERRCQGADHLVLRAHQDLRPGKVASYLLGVVGAYGDALAAEYATVLDDESAAVLDLDGLDGAASDALVAVTAVGGLRVDWMQHAIPPEPSRYAQSPLQA